MEGNDRGSVGVFINAHTPEHEAAERLENIWGIYDFFIELIILQ